MTTMEKTFKLYRMYDIFQGYDEDTTELICEDLFGTMEEDHTVDEEELEELEGFNPTNTNFGWEKNEEDRKVKVGDHFFINCVGVKQIFREGCENIVECEDSWGGQILGTKSGFIKYVQEYGEDLFPAGEFGEDETKRIIKEVLEYLNNLPTEFPE